MDKYREYLTPFFGKRCVITGGFTYEEGLYFYAIDSEVEKALAKAALESAVGSWKVLADSDLKVSQANVVVFGATLDADNEEEPEERVAKAINKQGLKGLVKVGLSTPGPLFYDRSNGNAFFFPDGEPMTLGKGGRKPRKVDALGIRVVGASAKQKLSGGGTSAKRKLSVGARLEMTNNDVIDLLDAGSDPETIIARIEEGLEGMTIEKVRASKFDCPEHFGWLLMKKGELLERLARPAKAVVAYASAVHAGEKDAQGPLNRLKKT